MQIDRNIPKHKNMDLYVDNWKMQELEHTNIEVTEENEVFDGEEDIHEIDNTKYLDQI